MDMIDIRYHYVWRREEQSVYIHDGQNDLHGTS